MASPRPESVPKSQMAFPLLDVLLGLGVTKQGWESRLHQAVFSLKFLEKELLPGPDQW